MSSSGPQTTSSRRGLQRLLGKSKAQAPSSGWLAPSILIVRVTAAAAECAPFPCVSGVFGAILSILETIEKGQKNHDDLKVLCQNIQEIVTILQQQLLSHGNTAAVRLRDICEELETFLQTVHQAVRNLQSETQGFRGHVKYLVKANSIAAEITRHEKRIQEFRSRIMFFAVVDTNFRLHEITATTSTNCPVLHTEGTNNCSPPSRIFYGRQAILDEMYHFFTSDIKNQHIYVLHGLGGAGKTQIALKLIQESTKFTDRFFIDASTTETIETGLRNTAIIKNTGKSSADALKWLTSTQEEWLLFFDNADDPALDLNQFLPKCGHGNIVITSRNPELRGYGENSVVSDMEESDAVTLLLTSAGEDASSANEIIAMEIVKTLSYLPLAIVQAGAFILKSGALDSYMELYARNKVKLLSEKAAQTHDDYAWTVYTTWQMSFDKLHHPAAMLLQLCSFLHRDGITEEIFRRASHRCPLRYPPRENLDKAQQFLSQFLGPDGQWNSYSFLEVTNEIRGYSLMNFDPIKKSFSIHPLVHSWSRTTLIDSKSSHFIMGAILGMSISEILAQDIQLLNLGLLPHIDSLMLEDELCAAHFHSDSIVADFYPEYSTMYWFAGRYEDAEQLQIVVLQQYRELLGDDHSQTLKAMSSLALTCSALGHYKEEEELQVFVFETQRRLLGDEHPETLFAMQGLAVAYGNLGQFKQAENLHVVVLEKWREFLGDSHQLTLEAMYNLASTYTLLGQHKQAEELQLERRKFLGNDHQNDVEAMHDLAVTYESLGQYTQAKDLHVAVLGKQRVLLGSDHPKTLRTMHSLANKYWSLGQYTEAAELQDAVLEKRRKHLGDDHPDTLKAMHARAITHWSTGQYKEVAEILAVVFEKRERLLGSDHPFTRCTMNDLAQIYECLDQPVRADKLREEFVGTALEKQRESLGDDHPDTLKTMSYLGTTYYRLGQFLKAEELQVVVLAKQKNLLGEDHMDTVWAMHNLAFTYHALGQYAKAEEYRAKVVEKRQKLLGGDHLDTVSAMHNLACTYNELGQHTNAEELQVAVLEKRRKLLGDDHLDTVLAMDNLALTYHRLDRSREAEQIHNLIKANPEISKESEEEKRQESADEESVYKTPYDTTERDE
ncbi:hypothetical protein DFH06DRAFT_1066608 [Mycena polygramma]|nr:hypothetical protein DFH06DRAFT_1066608 [Mycena polygramma]